MHYAAFGKPDIAFPHIKLAIFCDSDFWYGKTSLPKTNQDYWKEKFQRNRRRDIEVNVELKKLGWTILRFSEKQILKDVEKCVDLILKQIEYNN